LGERNRSVGNVSAPQFPARFPAQLELPAELAVMLMEAAAKSIRASLQQARRARRPRRGETLKPGADTPLWNELATAVRGELSRYGEKARLGRVLGLPRQRIDDFLRARRHLPDAERTLLLLVWLQMRRQGRDLC
jgi:hypothetical protein